MRIIRVFPTRTNATPTDDLAAINRPPELFDVADAVHVSVTFSWDMAKAEALARQWACVAPVAIGGPAVMDTPSRDFVAGMYLKHGCTITSRGCPNQCWFCDVPKRDGGLRELPIVDGWNVMDSNLLACSRNHIEAVFKMLAKQKRRPVFSGGLEARRLETWHVELLRKVRTQRLYFAYDGPTDWDPLVSSVDLLRQGHFMARRSHDVICYVLCGFSHDTEREATKRVLDVYRLGILPMPMLYRDTAGKISDPWQEWRRKMGTNCIQIASTLRKLSQ